MGKAARNQPHSVRWWRLNAGLTRDELAHAARVAPGTLRRLELGYRSTVFAHEAERRVAAALGVEVEAVTFGIVEDGTAPISLTAEREARELTLSEVATQANVPRRTVVNAEAGVPIHPRHALRLAQFYSVKVTDFYPAERREAAA